MPDCAPLTKNAYQSGNTAFVDPDVSAGPTNQVGPLSGLTFAVKDLFEIQGRTVGAGNPLWESTHAPSERHAPVIARLLSAGACLRGVTVTDEMAFSLVGDNVHFGAPPNPRAPDCFTGGSSCGSASAVAQGTVDFALGTDTAGSIRVPSAFSGVFGLRPSKKTDWTEGVHPLSTSFDVCGWMAKDIKSLDAVTAVLTPSSHTSFDRVLLDLAGTEQLDGEYVDHLKEMAHRVASSIECPVAQVRFGRWSCDCGIEAFRTVQAYEAWNTHKVWLGTYAHALSAPTRERFEFGQSVSKDDYERAKRTCAAMELQVARDIGSSLVLRPTTLTGPLRRDSILEEQANYRASVLRSTCVSSVCGLPELVLPFVRQGHPPMGVSLIGRSGVDQGLTSVGTQVFHPLRQATALH